MIIHGENLSKTIYYENCRNDRGYRGKNNLQGIYFFQISENLHMVIIFNYTAPLNFCIPFIFSPKFTLKNGVDRIFFKMSRFANYECQSGSGMK